MEALLPSATYAGSFRCGDATVTEAGPKCEVRGWLVVVAMDRSAGSASGSSIIAISSHSPLAHTKQTNKHTSSQSLAGKVAVVTGAGTGLGRGIADRLAAAGMKVVGTSRNPAKYAGTKCVYKNPGDKCAPGEFGGSVECCWCPMLFDPTVAHV